MESLSFVVAWGQECHKSHPISEETPKYVDDCCCMILYRNTTVGSRRTFQSISARTPCATSEEAILGQRGTFNQQQKIFAWFCVSHSLGSGAYDEEEGVSQERGTHHNNFTNLVLSLLPRNYVYSVHRLYYKTRVDTNLFEVKAFRSDGQ